MKRVRPNAGTRVSYGSRTLDDVASVVTAIGVLLGAGG